MLEIIVQFLSEQQKDHNYILFPFLIQLASRNWQSNKVFLYLYYNYLLR